MLKKRFSILVVALCTLLVFAGCSSKESSSEKTKKGEKATIEFAAWGGPEENKELEGLVEKVNADADDYKIKLINIPNDYSTKLQTMISGKKAPDIFYLSQEWVASYASKNILLDITDLAKNDNQLDLDDYYEEPLKTARYNDKLYGLPWISQPVLMYYNKAIFDEAGLPYPDNTWDWEQFRKVAKELTVDKNNDGRLDQWGTIANGWPPEKIWAWSYGGGFLNDNGEITIDSPETIEGLQVYYDILHTDKSVPSSNTIEQQGLAEMFIAGKVAMFFGGAADDLDYIDGLDVGATVVPKGKERATFNWIANMVASADTENPEIAYKALRDMTDAIHHWKLAPPRKSMMDKLAEIQPKKTEEALAAIEESMEYAKGLVLHEKRQEIDSIIWDNLSDPLIRGEGTPEELAKKTAEKLKEFTGK
ncbi:ABC transporter substrate-binding protein [Lederbergia citrea]|uniref:Sugar ABC transporter substrate-binding protein n=1 Tax=Lederbergia citrea TaxID=2833581 RepID=A0A942UIB4_9BACI|nr:sugar ABC transporter substrate-binding protein [Lederbergia citrea]MBS4177592.1 sugar ABC transporter substrate-binding protein [Lederbergia citrea]MBS4204265.1 sugar ABC transporter substrate-binding protein [Lederbergia citrea]MBS4221150.1 sugar ABC transporter substrate-binding protein [Lederbergia citrea]